MAKIHRRKSVVADVGGVKVGGAHPIVVQSMTNTDTVCFHAQQCVEKYLKAYLVLKGRRLSENARYRAAGGSAAARHGTILDRQGAGRADRLRHGSALPGMGTYSDP